MKTIYTNARIFTADESIVDTMVVENGIITQLYNAADQNGANTPTSEIHATSASNASTATAPTSEISLDDKTAATATNEIHASTDATLIDLGGKVVLPGFSDAHTHPGYVVDIVDSLFCNQPNVYSIEQLIEYLKTSPAYGKPGEWIKGWCYDESKLQERRSPTTKDLDRVSTTQPIFIQRSCGHSCVCNSAALKLAGITRDTPDPAGGAIGRYDDGEPNGFMYDLAASNMIRKVMYQKDLEHDARKLGELGKHYASLGIVNLSDMMTFMTPYDPVALYERAREYGLVQRVSMYNMWEDTQKHAPQGFGAMNVADNSRIVGVKFFMDGSLSGKSGYVNTPYKDGTTGFLVHDDGGELERAFAWAREHKCQISMHAMGDGSIDMILDIAQRYDNWMGEYPSVRIEHVSLLSTKQIQRALGMDVKITFHPQPIFSYAELDGYTAALEPSELDRVCALRTWSELAPDRFTISSDAPATIHQSPENLFVSIKAAVRRISISGTPYNQSEQISVQKAITMLSKNAAPSLMLDGCGSLQVGYSADFIVIDKDIFGIDKELIDTINVERTYLRGELVYQR